MSIIINQLMEMVMVMALVTVVRWCPSVSCFDSEILSTRFTARIRIHERPDQLAIMRDACRICWWRCWTRLIDVLSLEGAWVEAKGFTQKQTESEQKPHNSHTKPFPVLYEALYANV